MEPVKAPTDGLVAVNPAHMHHGGRPVRRNLAYRTRRNYPYTSCTRLLAESCSTRRASPMRSTTRRSARPRPMTTSGSGAATSVHCGGTEQIVLSSMRSRSRLPDRLWRSPTQTSCRSANGWKGWVTRTSCAEATVWSAFAGELQAAGEGQVRLAADRRRRSATDGGATGAAARRHRLASHRGAAADGASKDRLSARTHHKDQVTPRDCGCAGGALVVANRHVAVDA